MSRFIKIDDTILLNLDNIAAIRLNKGAKDDEWKMCAYTAGGGHEYLIAEYEDTDLAHDAITTLHIDILRAEGRENEASELLDKWLGVDEEHKS